MRVFSAYCAGRLLLYISSIDNIALKVLAKGNYRTNNIVFIVILVNNKQLIINKVIARNRNSSLVHVFFLPDLRILRTFILKTILIRKSKWLRPRRKSTMREIEKQKHSLSLMIKPERKYQILFDKITFG